MLHASKTPKQRHAVLGRQLWRLAPFVRPYTRRIVVGMLANAGARFFDLLPLILVGKVVDAARGGTIAPSAHTFLLYGLAVLATFAALSIFQSVSDYNLDTMAQLVRHDLRMKLYEHVQSLDVGYFEERQAGDIMSVIAGDVDTLEQFLADATTSMVRLVITFLGVYGVLFFLEWRLALLLLVPLPVAIFVVRFFATRIQPRYRQARRAVGEVNAVVENTLQGMSVIQAYGAEDQQARRVSASSAAYRDAAVAAAWERSRFVPLIYAVAGFGFALLIAGGGWMTYAEGGPSLGDYTTFILLAMRLILPLFVFGMLINQIQRSEAAAQRIAELLDIQPAVSDPPGAVALPGPPSRVEFADVRFAYPGREPALCGVDLRLERGRMVGVVGPTGAGKSTLVKLALRFYHPESGRILVDGRDLAQVAVASYRSHVGYVSQESFLFFGSVADNIRLGAPEADDAAVRQAAEVAGAHEFISRLPEGYATLVGERGLKLSGGQRQRISLARAVLRDPALMVLDEATSAVDTETERLIQENLARFGRERMILAVAHRLSTVRKADEIVVLVDGRVAERGSHEQLVAHGGVYAGLWEVQQGESF